MVRIRNQTLANFRFWIMLNPDMELFFCQKGYVRLATDSYSLKSKDKLRHLTNNSLQKYAENYSKDDDIISMETLQTDIRQTLNPEYEFTQHTTPQIIIIARLLALAMIRNHELISKSKSQTEEEINQDKPQEQTKSRRTPNRKPIKRDSSADPFSKLNLKTPSKSTKQRKTGVRKTKDYYLSRNISVFKSCEETPLEAKYLDQKKQVHSYLRKWGKFADQKVKHSKKRCFQIFGIDLMLDAQLDVWLLEVNTNPSLDETNATLEALIPRMLDDALKLTVDQYFPSQKGDSFIY